ncbi:hypothetical protein [Polynucleobacter sp. UK-Kesae-W10]|uniref:hypothetical protein n=1 Tax=Polynucleobacter sp. UK-Kesae-W10 TaxID=1819738 RepID=UPI001C0E6CE3|nr:hypothetical protein [Polynucleobacter sp. UK-Kesae-W10]MBU3577513.1 hypothetical protein [Polynucleobacter sp. UK-Kesae-W10]
MLEEAEQGEIVGIIAAVHYGGDEQGFFGSGTMCSIPTMGLHALLNLAKKLL